jgi:nucleoside-diphosphate-sugar epimerase
MTEIHTMAEFWRGRRVLLTGHTGFKGAWMSLWLEGLGAEVTGIQLQSQDVGFQLPPRDLISATLEASCLPRTVRDARSLVSAAVCATMTFR